MKNKAFIPLYLNNTMINNLFTVVINTFVEIKTVNTRNQISLNINAPLSEILYNTCGQYVQGDFNLQVVDEFSKQRTEEQISTNIIIFMKLMDILEQQNLLKDLNTPEDINDIKINDYVQFISKLNPNPQVQYMEDLMKTLQMELAFAQEAGEKTANSAENIDKREVLSQIKSNLDDLKNNGCLRFISDGLCSSTTKSIVPLETKYMQDNLDYLNNTNVSVVGKVVNISKDTSTPNQCLKSCSCFDYLNEGHFNNFKNRLLNNSNTISDFSHQALHADYPTMEIIPFALYL